MRRLRAWLRPSAPAAGLGLLLAVCGLAPGGEAAAQSRREPRDYVIEFRARPSVYLGHTFIVYGRLDGSGRIVERHQAGFIPGDDFMMAFITPVRGTIGTDPDDRRLPTTATYRRRLSAAEYQRVVAKVQWLRATQRRWHFFFYNCNDFAIEIADTLGLFRMPSLVAPDLWVDGLRFLNRD